MPKPKSADDLFLEQLEQDFSSFSPRQSLKERAKQRDANKDEQTLQKRLTARRTDQRAKAAEGKRHAAERQQRRQADQIIGRQNQRTTKQRLELKRDLIKKVSGGSNLALLTPAMFRCEKRSCCPSWKRCRRRWRHCLWQSSLGHI